MVISSDYFKIYAIDPGNHHQILSTKHPQHLPEFQAQTSVLIYTDLRVVDAAVVSHVQGTVKAVSAVG